jgi:hypothetical protein
VTLVVNVVGTTVVDRVSLDKPLNEPAGNYAMWEENIHRATLEGRGITLSDSVVGMTMPQRQHVSYFLEWEERTKASDPMPPTTTLTERFIQLARAEFGAAFEDLRGQLTEHQTKRFSPIDSRTMQFLCFHHSGTPTTEDTTWESVASHHVNGNGWAGIGYHGGIRRGKVALFADLDTQRAHVLNRNHEALGWCIMGNYTQIPLSSLNLDTMRRLVKILDAVYERDKDLTWHGKMLPGHTECPGLPVQAAVPTLRDAPPPAPEWTRRQAAISTWYLEQLARALRGDAEAVNALVGAIYAEPKDAGLHNVLVQIARPPMVEERDS